MNDKIIIKGIEFYAHHGASDEEQVIGHRYFADVILEADLSRAGATDNLDDTVSYSKVARLVHHIGVSNNYRLLEALAVQIADAVLNEFEMIAVATIRVGKKLPPAKLIIESASVEITRQRK